MEEFKWLREVAEADITTKRKLNDIGIRRKEERIGTRKPKDTVNKNGQEGLVSHLGS